MNVRLLKIEKERQKERPFLVQISDCSGYGLHPNIFLILCKRIQRCSPFVIKRSEAEEGVFKISTLKNKILYIILSSS